MPSAELPPSESSSAESPPAEPPSAARLAAAAAGCPSLEPPSAASQMEIKKLQEEAPMLGSDSAPTAHFSGLGSAHGPVAGPRQGPAQPGLRQCAHACTDASALLRFASTAMESQAACRWHGASPAALPGPGEAARAPSCAATAKAARLERDERERKQRAREVVGANVPSAWPSKQNRPWHTLGITLAYPWHTLAVHQLGFCPPGGFCLSWPARNSPWLAYPAVWVPGHFGSANASGVLEPAARVAGLIPLHASASRCWRCSRMRSGFEAALKGWGREIGGRRSRRLMRAR
eukprot:scaffold15009_cov62-Phaeocystis_antarctica.AAC.3